MLRQGGFSLIELMVALLLLSITLLGTARLQLAAQHKLEQAFYSGQALALIEEASRRVSLNYAERDSYVVSELSNIGSFHCNPCSPRELAHLDLVHLSENLLHLLPQGQGRIFPCSAHLCMSVSWLQTSIEECEVRLTCIQRVL
jgi:type IV pilus assembly protein PilV